MCNTSDSVLYLRALDIEIHMKCVRIANNNTMFMLYVMHIQYSSSVFNLIQWQTCLLAGIGKEERWPAGVEKLKPIGNFRFSLFVIRLPLVNIWWYTILCHILNGWCRANSRYWMTSLVDRWKIEEFCCWQLRFVFSIECRCYMATMI